MIHGFWVRSKTGSFFTCSDPSAFVILGASSKFFDIFVHFCVSYAIGRCNISRKINPYIRRVI